MKKRLTGAIVLVALVVIFVPMLLDDKEPDITLGPLIPEQPQDTFREDLIPGEKTTTLEGVDLGDRTRYELPVGEIVDAEPTPVQPPVPPQPVPEIQPVEQPAEVPEPVVAKPEIIEEKPAPAPAATPASKPAPASTSGQGWVIQAGSFGQRENADKLVAKLKQSGKEAFIEPIDVQGKTLHRVRIGPYSDRAKADAEMAAVEKDFRLKAKVLAFP